MINELSTILMAFAPCFSRTAAFRWFVVTIFGLIVRLDFHGVTSFIRWLALDPELYETLLSFFRTSSWQLSKIHQCWVNIIKERCPLITINDHVLMVGDGIKTPKEAKRMPGVKKLHQESDNSSKAPYIFGHHFGMLGLLAGSVKHMFCVPVMAEIHEGVEKLRVFQGKEPPVFKDKKGVTKKEITIVTLMLSMASNLAKNMVLQPCMLVLDAYFSSGATFLIARDCLGDTGQRLLHVITRAKDNAVAYEGPPPLTDQKTRKRGRPSVWGEKVNLWNQFSLRANEFQTLNLCIYGKKTTLSYICLDLLWKPVKDKLRFVLVKDGNNRYILLCSNLSWLPEEIILAYSYRFKIEISFKRLKHLLGSFCYHYWTSAMPRLGKKAPVNLDDVSEESKQRRIAKTANAIEGFVNFGCIALGCLQILALNYSQSVWSEYTGWLRTKRSDVPSEETVRSVIRKKFYHNFSDFSNSAIYQIIMAKKRQRLHLYGDDAA
jgi:hypothetical protein